MIQVRVGSLFEHLAHCFFRSIRITGGPRQARLPEAKSTLGCSSKVALLIAVSEVTVAGSEECLML